MQVGISSSSLRAKKRSLENSRPNILMLITDQQRGDCLGIEGHPVLQTPNLDWIAATGTRFSRAYAASPVCIPARRTLMTGRRPASHGVLMNYQTHLQGETLPAALTADGYQTHLVGKLHLWPLRKLYGFMSADWADGPAAHPGIGDYGRFLRQNGLLATDAGVAHGVNQNGWVARPWHLDERFHFTNWCADRAIDFLETRDPTAPFFLKVSFHQPHQPCTPPPCYWERYMSSDIPEPYVGEWARVFSEPQRGLPPAAWRTYLEPVVMRQYRAGYYGCINHIDDQIGRILNAVPENTIILFLSDHGDMLGDHQWIRKRNAFEPSARVPLLIRFPVGVDIERGRVLDHAVELMDVMPTVLDAAGVSIPGTVEGRSLMPLLRSGPSPGDPLISDQLNSDPPLGGQGPSWRPYIHGECSDIPSLNSGMQFLTDGKMKYIWYPGQDREQLFDLVNDPREMQDLASEPARKGELQKWREVLVGELETRPEGFVREGRLQRLPGPTDPYLPGFKNPELDP